MIKIGERESKVLRIRDKKDKMIKLVNAQKGGIKIKEKLEEIFKERKSKERKMKSWMKLKS